MAHDTDRELDTGPLRRRRAQGAKSDQLVALMCELEPALGEWADGFIFGDVWGRPGISHDERMLVAITAIAAIPNTDQLRTYLWGAVQAGISARKVQEALVMLVIYAGFPRALGPLTVWRSVLDGARKAGVPIDLDTPAEAR